MRRAARAKPNVVVGFIGTKLDAARASARWERWRPTVSLCSHPDLPVARLELLHDAASLGLARVVADDIATVSPTTTVLLHEIGLRDPWDFEDVYGAMLDWVRGRTFRPDEEDYFVHMTTGTHVAQICWFLLTESREIPARLLQTAPAPSKGSGGAPGSGVYRVIDLDLGRYDRIAARFQRAQQEGVSFLKAGIETRNPRFNALVERIETVAARSRAPILLTGPTGAGKTRLARRIYEFKLQRRQVTGPFVELNCATIRGDQAMSMLFGHARGAFTGATKDRAGLLATADGGVLFLDEIGELGLDEQAMLLRAIEDKRFLPMGSDRDVSSDFQLIAGTNRDLARGVSEGRFREDLLARIDLWTFELPGLRERPEDVAPNLDYELTRHADQGHARVTFNKEGRERFVDFATAPTSAWLGNFRDFSAAIERMATLAPGGRITREVVDEEIRRLERSWARETNADPDNALLEQTLGRDACAELDLFDRVQLAAVLRVCRRSRSLSDAGRVLFAASRRARASINDADRLRKYLAKWGLSWESIHDGA
jgi:transcriptional regulatory protein RtcR